MRLDSTIERPHGEEEVSRCNEERHDDGSKKELKIDYKEKEEEETYIPVSKVQFDP